jgi:hypothetical protein
MMVRIDEVGHVRVPTSKFGGSILWIGNGARVSNEAVDFQGAVLQATWFMEKDMHRSIQWIPRIGGTVVCFSHAARQLWMQAGLS